MDSTVYDNDIRNMGLEQMRRARVLLQSELKSIESQISDLAFNNYGTYADAGRATHDCSKTFGDMRDRTTDLSSQSEELMATFQEFRTKSKILSAEQELVKKALDKSNPIWELLSLPSRMDVCIRAGYYDLAYSLTNYGMQLQQQPQLIKNPLIKKVADKLVESRSYLLEELFNKFTGPLDLAESIKVINNVRKMPYLTANQLRIAVLQHRDIYLDKQILDISGHSDMLVQAIEIYRTCMYDTLVLYLAVFTENETIRKNPSMDPRWESWPTLPPSSLLSQWAISNIKRLLDLIQRTEMKTAIDLSTIWSKLMTMGSSFGRMGIDFRPLIAARLTLLIENRFKKNVQEVTNKLTGSSRDIVMIGIDPASLPQFETAPDAPPVPSAELSLWDDLTVYANSIVDSLNGVRFLLTPVLLSTVVSSLRDSIRQILSWLSTSHSNSANFSRAVQIITTCLAPFFEKCVAFFFPPSVVIKLFGSAISKQKYMQFIEFDMRQLAASCDGSDKIEHLIIPFIQKKTLADINLEAVLKTTESENQPATFFLDDGLQEKKRKEDNVEIETIKKDKEDGEHPKRTYDSENDKQPTQEQHTSEIESDDKELKTETEEPFPEKVTPNVEEAVDEHGTEVSAKEEESSAKSEETQEQVEVQNIEMPHSKTGKLESTQQSEEDKTTDWDDDGWGKTNFEEQSENDLHSVDVNTSSTQESIEQRGNQDEDVNEKTNTTQSSVDQQTTQDDQTENTEENWADNQEEWGWDQEEEKVVESSPQRPKKDGKND